jgi:succinate dehydrogenase/fumarate reductase-like Fe-S protein
MVNIYRLQYASKAEALKDLKSKKVINAKGQYINDTESVVDCGIITLAYAAFDENEKEITPAVFADGYHYNIMTTDEIVFNSEVFPTNPKYKFGGHE